MGNALICLPHSAVAEAVASRSIAASLVPRRHDAVATASMTLPARLLNGITGRVHVLQEGTTVAEVNCSILKSPTPSQLSPQTKIWRIDACTFSYQCINSTGEPLQKSSPSFLALQSWRWRRIPCCLHNHSYRSYQETMNRYLMKEFLCKMRRCCRSPPQPKKLRKALRRHYVGRILTPMDEDMKDIDTSIHEFTVKDVVDNDVDSNLWSVARARLSGSGSWVFCRV